MKYLKHILFSFLLLFSGVVFSQNKLITSGSNFIAVGDNLISTPFNQYSLTFDGVDEFIDINSTLIPLSFTTVGTQSLWVRPVDATPSISSEFISFGDTDGNEFLIMRVATSGLLQAFARTPSEVKWDLDTDAIVFTDNTWTHIALVQPADGNGVILYVDGSKPNQSFNNTAFVDTWFNDLPDLDNVRLACDNFNNGGNLRFYNGNIDEVSLWKKALSQAEINEIYNAGVPKNLLFHSAAIDLVGWFRMGDGDTFSTDWTLTDNSINNNTGTSVNMEFLDRTHAKP